MGNHKKNKINFQSRVSIAFTLAEVLITLGIIGIVSSITIPTLIKNYQKTQTIVQLKKNYTIINQAYQNAQSELGPSGTWNLPATENASASSIPWWKENFIPYAKLVIQKKCAALVSGCFSTGAKQLDGAPAIVSSYESLILQDGTFVSLGPVSNTTANIDVDINGNKGPNVYGKDIFVIQIFYTNGKVMMGGADHSRAYLLSDSALSCSKTSGSYKGRYCGGLIQLDGWQIKDDYPW